MPAAPATTEPRPVTMRIEQRGSKWVVLPESGDKVLGEHDTKTAAEAQLRAIEASKHAEGTMGTSASTLHHEELLQALNRVGRYGRRQHFDAGTGQVKAGTWDRFTSWGQKIKDGQEDVFNEDTLGQMVDNWRARSGRLPLCLDHSSTLGGFVPAPAAAFYDALAIVHAGQVVRFERLAGSTAESPDPAALKAQVMKFANAESPDPEPDGLWGWRAKVTPLGLDPARGLANYEGLSPFFDPHGADEQGNPVGYVLYDVAAVNVQFQAGCELTMAALRRLAGIPEKPGAHAMSVNVGDRIAWRLDNTPGKRIVRGTIAQVSTGQRGVRVQTDRDGTWHYSLGEIEEHGGTDGDPHRLSGMVALSAVPEAMARASVGDVVEVHAPPELGGGVYFVGLVTAVNGDRVTVESAPGRQSIVDRKQINPVRFDAAPAAGEAPLLDCQHCGQKLADIDFDGKLPNHTGRDGKTCPGSEQPPAQAAAMGAVKMGAFVDKNGRSINSGDFVAWQLPEGAGTVRGEQNGKLVVEVGQRGIEYFSPEQARRLEVRNDIGGKGKMAVVPASGEGAQAMANLYPKGTAEGHCPVCGKHINIDENGLAERHMDPSPHGDPGWCSGSKRKLTMSAASPSEGAQKMAAYRPGDRVEIKNAKGTYVATVHHQIPGSDDYAVNIESGPDMAGWVNVAVPERLIARKLSALSPAAPGGPNGGKMNPELMQRMGLADGATPDQKMAAYKAHAFEATPEERAAMAADLDLGDDKAKAMAGMLRKMDVDPSNLPQNAAIHLKTGNVHDEGGRKQGRLDAPPFEGKETPEEEKAEAEAKASMAKAMGLAPTANLAEIARVFSAKTVPLSDVAKLREENGTLSGRIAALEGDKISAAAQAFGRQAVADGQTLEEKLSDIVAAYCSAEKTKSGSGASTVGPMLYAKGTFTAGRRYTAGGNIVGVKDVAPPLPGNGDVRAQYAVKANEISVAEKIPFAQAMSRVKDVAPELYAAYLALGNPQ